MSSVSLYHSLHQVNQDGSSRGHRPVSPRSLFPPSFHLVAFEMQMHHNLGSDRTCPMAGPIPPSSSRCVCTLLRCVCTAFPVCQRAEPPTSCSRSFMQLTWFNQQPNPAAIARQTICAEPQGWSHGPLVLCANMRPVPASDVSCLPVLRSRSSEHRGRRHYE